MFSLSSLNQRVDHIDLQNAQDFRQVIEEFFSLNRVKNNWLIGKGVLIESPFEYTITPKSGQQVLSISGTFSEKKVIFEFLCQRAVIGEFRPQMTLITSDESGNLTFKKLVPFQPSRVSMLNLVSPGSSISKQDFINSTRKPDGNLQTDAPRRWRELRNEYGFDVSEDGGRYHRGVSLVPVNEPQPRPDMSKLMKNVLPQMLELGLQKTCNKCGRSIQLEDEDEGFVGLLDHRRPVLFGGSDKIENLQGFCTQCNNVKARFCNSCPIQYRCEECTWAYPEHFHDTLMLHLEPEKAAHLQWLASQAGEKVEHIAISLLNKALEEIPRRLD